MKKHPWYFVIGAALVIAAFVIIYLVNKDPDYTVADYFTEQNEVGKITFMFIQIAEQDTAFMAELGKELLTEHPAVQSQNGKLSTLVAYFYNPADTASPPRQLIAEVSKKYPADKNLIHKLDYIPNGYVYIGTSKDVEGLGVPQNKLQNSLVLAPKKGVKAEEIFRRNAPIEQAPDSLSIKQDTNIIITPTPEEAENQPKKKK